VSIPFFHASEPPSGFGWISDAAAEADRLAAGQALVQDHLALAAAQASAAERTPGPVLAPVVEARIWEAGHVLAQAGNGPAEDA